VNLPTGSAVTLQEMLDGRTLPVLEEERILEPLFATAPARVSARIAELRGPRKFTTGAHYTPRWLAEQIVKRTLDPLLLAIEEQQGKPPTSEQILSLKVCDPAMGAGVFLLAAVRYLGDRLVEAWAREGKLEGGSP
jgi:hypothetical protein